MPCIRRAVAGASLLCLVAGAASAAPLFSDLTFSTGIGWSDNITGVATNQQSETIAAAGVRALIDRNSRLFDLNLDLDLQYIDYLRNKFDSELAGNSELNARFAIVPETLSLVVEDTFGQTQASAFAPSTPGTRQNTNLLAAGPDLRLSLGESLIFMGSGRYAVENFQRTNADNERFQGTAGFYHEFSGRSSLGVLAQAQDVNFDAAQFADFIRREALLRYRLNASRTTVLMDAGRTEFRGRGVTPVRYNLWSYRFEASRNVTARTTLELAAGRMVSDSGELFASSLESTRVRSSLAQSGLGAIQTMGANIVATGDALRNQYGRATWRLVGPRARANIAFEARQERYITGNSIDRKIYSVLAGMSRDFSQRLNLAADLRHSQRDAETTTIVVKDFAAALTGRYRASARISMSLTFEYSNRNDNAGGGDFSDRRAWLGLAYSPITR
jgi:hypothetical protein